MVSSFFDKVMIFLGMDTSEADAKTDASIAKSDAATERARIQRLEIIQGVRESLTLISTSYATFTQFMRVVGGSIDPFYSALIGMSLSMVSMMISMASALAATGVGIPAAVVIGGIAIVLQSMLIAKLIGDKAIAMEAFNLDKWAVGAAQQSGIGTFGGGF